MNDLELTALSMTDVASLIEQREVSPVAVVEASLAAIARHDDTLNAFRLVLHEESMAAAREAEAEIVNGNYRGPLHGIPVAVKDLMDLAGTTTPAGSTVLASSIATEDSVVVRKLKDAGAIIIGKTHMPEFAYAPSSHNEHYGPVRNPWALDYDTGGSSSGSGSAVAAGMVYGATGSDTGGSIRIPAALCGLVGIKATFGVVSARGAVPLSWSLDHIGPMTRTVRDGAEMLDAMAGYDPGDSRTSPYDRLEHAAALTGDGAGLRVALVTNDDLPGDFCTPAVLAGLHQAASTLANAGAEVQEITMPLLHDLAMMTTGILNIEATACHEEFLRDRPEEIGRWTRLRLLGSYVYSPTAYVKIQQLRTIFRRQADRLMESYDLLLLPSVPHEAPLLGQVLQNNRFTSPFNGLGWPAISLPVDLGENDLPVGAQVVATPWREDIALRAAGIIEQGSNWNKRLAPLLAGS